MIKAWHFTSNTLRDGRPLPAPGEVLRHEGDLVICREGLHASRRLIDALKHAPGSMLHRVTCGGEAVEESDKLVCRERTIEWTIDADDLLWRFARKRALDVIHLWDAPEVVVDYLKTGDESLRKASTAASRAPSWAASKAASCSWAALWTRQNRSLVAMVYAEHRRLT